MAVRTVPEGCYLQPNNTESNDGDGNVDYTFDVKGMYADLESWKNTIVFGTDTFEGRVIVSTNLRRVPGDAGVLTITTDSSDSVDVSSGSVAYKGVWSFRAARNDMSILGYCGDAASRVAVELWQKETNYDLAKAYKYRDESGSEKELNDKEKLIAKKIEKGRESVVRFFPILTYTSYYKSCPRQWAVDIGLIRTPEAAAADRLIAPANINSVIEDFVWLKVQDDIEEMPETGFKRTQSWWGISEDDGGWDVDFYGPERWPIPLKKTNK